MPNELKPCPFCGGSVSIKEMQYCGELWHFVTRGTGENRCTCRLFMESEKIFVDAPQTIKIETRNKLIEAWNRRVDNA